MPPTDPQIPNSLKKPPQGGAGPIFGIIIIILLLVFGALYFWGQQLNKQSDQNGQTAAGVPSAD